MAASDSRTTPGRVQRKKARQTKVSDDERCITGDGKKVHARGLCGGCYYQASARVNAGETTWKELEAAGLAKPSAGRVSGTEFAKKFARLKGNGKPRGDRHGHQR